MRVCAGCVTMKPDHERVTKLLTDTVSLLCKNGLSYDREIRIQGLLGITVDDTEVFLVSINDSFQCSSTDSEQSTPSSLPPCSAEMCTDKTRNRSIDELIDLTRLVDTPAVPSQITSSISPVHCGSQTRPKSVGSVGHVVIPSSSSMVSVQHSPHVARQSQFVATTASGRHSTTSSRRNSAEQLASTNNQCSNALALVCSSVVNPQSHSSYAGYYNGIRNVMLACDRQLEPHLSHCGQHSWQSLAARNCGRTGTHRHSSFQHHQTMAAIGSTAAGDLTASGRAGAEHFAVPSQPHRQSVVPGDTCSRRPEATPQLYVAGPPFALPRQHFSDVQRPVCYDRSRYADIVQQMHMEAQRRRSADDAAMQPPAKRHAANHFPPQFIQPSLHRNPAFMHSTCPQPPPSYFPQTCITHSEQTPSAADPQSLNLLPVTSQSSTVESSPVIKPPSSPVHSGRRSRSRYVEHIDLCDDDETADSGIHIPVSSIVIQPDNVDSSSTAADDEAERLNAVSVNTSDGYVSGFDTVLDSSPALDDIPPLSHIHEIVPVDDGLEIDDVMRNVVTSDNSGPSTSSAYSAATVPGGASDSGRSNTSNCLYSGLSAVQPGTSGDVLDIFSHVWQ